MLGLGIESGHEGDVSRARAGPDSRGACMLFVILSRVPFDRSKAESPEAPAVILKANTIGSDAEATPNPFCPCFLLYGRGGAGRTRKSSQVELAHSSLEEIELAEQAATVFGSIVTLHRC